MANQELEVLFKNSMNRLGDLKQLAQNARPQSAIHAWNQFKQAIPNATKAVTKPAKSVAIEGGKMFVPYVGAGIDLASGYNKIKSGHPLIGAGQMGLGALEGLLDTGGLFAGALTGGTGYAGEKVAQASARQAIKQMARYAIQKYGKNAGKFVYQHPDLLMNTMKARNLVGSGKVQVPKTIADVLFSMGMGNDGDRFNDEAQQPTVEDVPVTDTTNYNLSDYGYNQQPSGIASYVNQSGMQQPSQQLPSNQVEQQYNQQQDYYGGSNIYDILENWKQQQEYMKPYREGLSRYVDEFDDRYDQSYARDRWTAAMADLGVPSMRNLIGKYTPVEQGAKKLDLQKANAEELQGIDKSYNELVSGMMLSKQAGLDPSVVLANPTVMKDILGKMQNDQAMDIRLQIASENNRIEMEKARLNNDIKIAIAQGRLNQAYALAQQRMRLDAQKTAMNNVFLYNNPQAVVDYANTNMGLGIKLPNSINNVGGQAGGTNADNVALQYKVQK